MGGRIARNKSVEFRKIGNVENGKKIKKRKRG